MEEGQRLKKSIMLYGPLESLSLTVLVLSKNGLGSGEWLRLANLIVSKDPGGNKLFLFLFKFNKI